MLRISQVICPIEHSEQQLFQALCQKLKCRRDAILEWKIVKRSVDARKKPRLFYSYTLLASCREEDKILKNVRKDRDIVKDDTVPFQFCVTGTKSLKKRPVIIGTGPAGLFCGLELARAGYSPILLERGKDVDRRTADVEAFWEGAPLEKNSNVQFGEGGAGTFSDGKLNTLIKDKSGRNTHVLETFVAFGADESILYDQKPHIGTDQLKKIVKRMREEIISLGGEVRFESQVTEVLTQKDENPAMNHKKAAGTEIFDSDEMKRRIKAVIINGNEVLETDILILAIGHSARDTFFMLSEQELHMEPKAFAVGFRVQHPQEFINEAQYGNQGGIKQPVFMDHTAEPDICNDAVSILGAASYKLTAKAGDGKGVYSFCMCPGGYVVNASSEEGYLAVNGMSYSARDGSCANSAVVVTVAPEDYETRELSNKEAALAGINFQRKLERHAYLAADGRIPIQKYGAFQEELVKKGVLDKAAHHTELPPFSPAVKGLYQEADVTDILPPELNKSFAEGMEQMNRKIVGFASDEVWLCGLESRTSSPVRICRDDTMQSNVRGIYPCGEGAGYAGGITSAAMDGIRIAQEIAAVYAPFYRE